jgi:hypothetical protein
VKSLAVGKKHQTQKKTEITQEEKYVWWFETNVSSQNYLLSCWYTPKFSINFQNLAPISKKNRSSPENPQKPGPLLRQKSPIFLAPHPRTLDARRPSVPAVPEAGLRRQLRQTLRAAADLGVHLASSARDGWGTVFTEKSWLIIWEIVGLTMKNGGKCGDLTLKNGGNMWI